MGDEKECFVICPIGEEDSPIRESSNKMIDFIISEPLEEFGYTPVRADEIQEPGLITTQVIQKTINSELVVADLTNHNPNVFYELALRHASENPYIQLIQSSEDMPFDISDTRTVQYSFEVESAEKAKSKIYDQLESIHSDEFTVESPISTSIYLQGLSESRDPEEQQLGSLIEMIADVNQSVKNLENIAEGTDHPFNTGNYYEAKERLREAERVINQMDRHWNELAQILWEREGTPEHHHAEEVSRRLSKLREIVD